MRKRGQRKGDEQPQCMFHGRKRANAIIDYDWKIEYSTPESRRSSVLQHMMRLPDDVLEQEAYLWTNWRDAPAVKPYQDRLAQRHGEHVHPAVLELRRREAL